MGNVCHGSASPANLDNIPNVKSLKGQDELIFQQYKKKVEEGENLMGPLKFNLPRKDELKRVENSDSVYLGQLDAKG